ncbi:MAG: hypothetical protein IJW52_06895 [Clostridia bacterium]|nr:hypothetical protein [Clostridia bacterium]
MIRGVNKRIIEVKINGSRLFDHAWLVFKNGDVANEMSERDIVAEANRMISEVGAKEKKKRHPILKTIGIVALCILCFAAGAAAGTMLK